MAAGKALVSPCDGKVTVCPITEGQHFRIKETDISRMTGMLTDKQRQFVDAVVEYMSNDLAKIGNEASLQMYGIKKFTEQYYFPIKSWEGVLNKSSASGTTPVSTRPV